MLIKSKQRQPCGWKRQCEGREAGASWHLRLTFRSSKIE
jgi:hypothetical protein